MHQRKILLLENVATPAAGLREHLSQAGYQVAVSRYEADGLKRLVEWGPEVVLVSTAHPAGDFVEYCRRARALAPAVRIIVTSALSRDRLFQEHPDLQAIVDGVLLRPYSREEVAALLAPAAGAARAPAAAPARDPDNVELRAEFQRQLDARFLEVEELKRRLEVASRRAASQPGPAWLQSGNDDQRQGVEETRKKAALALATEQLKRSEVEVKLDNLLRMKEDFEFRVQNEIDDRTQEIELVRGQLQEVRGRFDKEAAAHTALRVEMERALVEKEQVEERLHALESCRTEEVAPPEAAAVAAVDATRIAALAADLSAERAQAAAGQVALADALAQAAILEEALAREQVAREERGQLFAQNQALGEQVAAAARRTAEHQAQRELLEGRLAAADSAVVETRTALEAAGASRVALEKSLAQAHDSCAAAARLEQEHQREFAAQTQELLECTARAERRAEQLQATCKELERRLDENEAARLLAATEAGAVVEQIDARGAALATELERERAARAQAEQQADDLRARLESAERLAAEVPVLRTRVADQGSEIESLKASKAAVSHSSVQDLEQCARELELLRSQQAQGAAEQEQERRASAALLEQAVRDRAESERRVAALREEIAAAAQDHDREVRLLGERSAAETAASRAAAGRCESAAAALVAAREAFEAKERELRLQLEAREASSRRLEEKLAARAVQEAGTEKVQAEVHHIQEILEEVISRARTEAVEYARRDAELSVRLQAALDERRLLQERSDRAGAEATERERRSSSLLQSAIDRGPSPPAERANLPALVPLAPPVSGRPRRWLVPVGLAVAALAVLLAVFALRSCTPQAVREQASAVPRPQPGAAPGAALTPREVWDRWTRSDGSGGVVVQATLRSEEELRAEIEADRARGLSAAEVGAELARRLSAFQFRDTYYVTVYLKNLAPGYPAYLDDLPGRFRLRDGGGKEVPAFLPPGHEKDRRIFSFGAGVTGDLIYEASVSLGFARAGLSPATTYLQLVVSDVGAASRRVLTWELE